MSITQHDELRAAYQQGQSLPEAQAASPTTKGR